MATRRERVVLELEDRFTTGMARAAASAALLNKELDSLSRDAVRTRRGMSDIDSGAVRLGQSSERSGNQIDRLSGRMRILADVAAVLGPSLIPVGAVGVPAIAGLASQLGFAAGAAGVAVLAFQGVGDSLKTLNKAALDPTKENLEAAQIALEKLSPAAQGFVTEVGRLLPQLRELRDVAAGGFFPGATEGLRALETALPKVQNVVASIATELGNISADAGAALASDRWTPFLDFIAREAPEALSDMAKATGHVTHALAALWMATDPLNDDFSQWLVDATADIDRWATGLAKTQGFADFLAYVESTGPKVADALGAIANAAIQIIQAAAPLGGPVLEGITALANLVSAIADSDLGTPIFTAVAALALFNRTLAITNGLQRASFSGPGFVALKSYQTRLGALNADLATYNSVQNSAAGRARATAGQMNAQAAAATRLRATLGSIGKSAALISAVGVAASGAADKIGLTNTASLALMGTFISPGWGTAIGAAAGGAIDLAHANDGLEDAIKRVNAAAKSADFSEMDRQIDDLRKRVTDLNKTSSVGDFFGDITSKVGSGLNHPFSFAVGSSPDEARARNAIRDATSKAEAAQTKAALELIGQGFLVTADGAKNAARSTEDFKQSLDKLNQALTGRADLRDYEQALDDFAQRAQERANILGEVAVAQRDLAGAKTPAEREAARQRIADLKEQAAALKNTLDIGTQAGRDTQAALDNIATTALRFATTLSGVDRVKFLAGARTQFIAAAKEAGYTETAARNLADAVLGLSNVKGEPKIVIDADGAWRVIDETQRRINRVKGKTVKLLVDMQTSALQAAGGRDGDPSTPYADGGLVRGPGGPREDLIPARLSDGEFVVNAAATRRNRALLEQINAQRFADGGYVTRLAGPVTGASAIDYSRLADAMSQARPLYGDVSLQPHDYNEFRREMEADHRRASLDGVRR